MMYYDLVGDVGAGLSVEHQTKLFKSIIQFNASKLQGGKGSGLGLYISKGSTTPYPFIHPLLLHFVYFKKFY